MADNESLQFDLGININGEEDIDRLASTIQLASESAKSIDTNLSGMSNASSMFASSLSSIVYQMSQTSNALGRLKKDYNALGLDSHQRTSRVAQASSSYKSSYTASRLIQKGGSFDLEHRIEEIKALPDSLKRDVDKLIPDVTSQIRDLVIDQLANPHTKKALTSKQISDRFVRSNNFKRILENNGLGSIDKDYQQQIANTISKMTPYMVSMFNTGEYHKQRFGTMTLAGRKDLKVSNVLPKSLLASWEASVKAQREMFVASKRTEQVASGNKYVSQKAINELLIPELASNPIAVRAGLNAGILHRAQDTSLQRETNITGSMLKRYQQELYAEIINRTTGREKKLNPFALGNEERIVPRMMSSSAGQALEAAKIVDKLINSEFTSDALSGPTRTAVEREAKRSLEQYAVKRVSMASLAGGSRSLTSPIKDQIVSIQQSAGTDLLGLKGHNNANTDAIVLMSIDETDKEARRKFVKQFEQHGYYNNGIQYVLQGAHGTGQDATLRFIRKDLYDSVRGDENVEGSSAYRAKQAGLAGTNVWNGYVDPAKIRDARTFGRFIDANNKLFTPSADIGVNIGDRLMAIVDFKQMMGTANPADGAGWMRRSFLNRNIQGRGGTSDKGVWQTIDDDLEEYAKRAGFIDKNGKWMVTGVGGEKFNLLERDSLGKYIYAGIQDISQTKNLPSIMDSEGKYKFTGKRANEALSRSMQELGLREVRDVENFDINSDRIGAQMAGFMNLSPAFRQKLTQDFMDEMEAIRTPEGQIKRVFSGNTDTLSKNITAAYERGDTNEAERLLISPEAVKRIRDYETARRRDFAGGVLYDKEGKITNQLLATTMTGAFMNAGFKPSKEAYNHWGDILRKNFSDKELKSMTDLYGGSMESFIDQLFTLKYDDENRAAIIDFNHINDEYVALNRAPSGRGSGIYARNLAKYAEPLYAAAGESVSKENMYVPVSFHSRLSGSDLDGDKVKVMTGDFAQQMKTTIENWDRLLKINGIDPNDKSLTPKTTSIDFEEAKKNGNLLADQVDLLVAAGYGMSRGSKQGQQGAIFDINDPNMSERIIRTAIYGNKAYDVSTTSPKNFAEVADMPADFWNMLRVGKEYTQYGKSFSSIFNVPMDRSEEGLAKAGLTEDDIQTFNGIDVNMKALREAQLDRVNFASMYKDNELLAIGQAIKLREAGLMSTKEADAVRQALDTIELPAWAGEDTKAYLKATRDARHEQYVGLRGSFSDDEIESFKILRDRAAEELDRSLLHNDEYRSLKTKYAKDRYREQQLAMIGANVAENAEDVVASASNLTRRNDQVLIDELRNADSVKPITATVGEIPKKPQLQKPVYAPPSESSVQNTSTENAENVDQVALAVAMFAEDFERQQREQQTQKQSKNKIPKRKYKLIKPKYKYEDELEGMIAKAVKEDLAIEANNTDGQQLTKDQIVAQYAPFGEAPDIDNFKKHPMKYKVRKTKKQQSDINRNADAVKEQVSNNINEAVDETSENILEQMFDRDLYNSILEKQSDASSTYMKEIYSDKQSNPMKQKLGIFDYKLKEANEAFDKLEWDKNGLIKGLNASQTREMIDAHDLAQSQYIDAMNHATSEESIEKIKSSAQQIIDPMSSSITNQLKNIETLTGVESQIGSAIYGLQHMDLSSLSNKIEDATEETNGLSPRAHQKQLNEERIAQLREDYDAAKNDRYDYISKLQQENFEAEQEEIDEYTEALKGKPKGSNAQVNKTIDYYKKKIERSKRDNKDRLFNDLISEDDYNTIDKSLEELSAYVNSNGFKSKIQDINLSKERAAELRKQSADLYSERYWEIGERMNRNLYGGRTSNDLGSRIVAAQDQAINTIGSRMQQNQQMQVSAESELQEALKSNDVAAIDKARSNISKLNNEYKNLIDQMQAAQGASGMFVAGLNVIGEAVNRVVMQFGKKLFQQAIQEAKRFVQEYDAAMTEIQMITLKSDDEMSSVGSNAINTALSLRTSVSNVTSTMSALYRQGLNDVEVQERTEDVVKFARVAGIKTTEATKIITTALNNNLVSSSQEAMDVLVALGDSAATTAGEISKAMQKSAATAKQAGVDYGELTSMITLVESKTQLSGTQVGTAMNTIFSRMRAMSVSEYAEDENGEVTYATDVAEALGLAGVQLFDGMGGFRDATDVLLDLAKAWNTLSETQQSVITKSMAGTRMTNIFSTLMEGLSEDNGELFEKYLGLTEDSDGVTDKKYEVAMESLAASLDNVKTSFDALIASMVESGSVQSILDGFAGFLQGLADASKNSSGLATWITGIGAAIAGVAAMVAASSNPLTAPISGLLGLLAGAGTALAVGSIFGAAAKNSETEEQKKKEEERKNAIKAAEVTRTAASKQLDITSDAQNSVNELRKIGTELDQLKNKTEGAWDGLDTSEFVTQLETLENLFPGISKSILESIGDIDEWNTQLDEVEKRILELNKKSIQASMGADASDLKNKIETMRTEAQTEADIINAESSVIEMFTDGTYRSALTAAKEFTIRNIVDIAQDKSINPGIFDAEQLNMLYTWLLDNYSETDLQNNEELLKMSLYDYYQGLDSNSKEGLGEGFFSLDQLFQTPGYTLLGSAIMNDEFDRYLDENVNKWLQAEAVEYFDSNPVHWNEILQGTDFADTNLTLEDIIAADTDKRRTYYDLKEKIGQEFYEARIAPLLESTEEAEIPLLKAEQLNEIYDGYIDNILDVFEFTGLTSTAVSADSIRTVVKDQFISELGAYAQQQGIEFSEALFDDDAVRQILTGDNGIVPRIVDSYFDNNQSLTGTILTGRYKSESGQFADTIPVGTAEVWTDTQTGEAVNTVMSLIRTRGMSQRLNIANEYAAYENFRKYMDTVNSFDELLNRKAYPEGFQQLMNTETASIASDLLSLLGSAENNPFANMSLDEFITNFSHYFTPDVVADEQLLQLWLDDVQGSSANLSRMRQAKTWTAISSALSSKYGDAFNEYVTAIQFGDEDEQAKKLQALTQQRASVFLADNYSSSFASGLSSIVSNMYSYDANDQREAIKAIQEIKKNQSTVQEAVDTNKFNDVVNLVGEGNLQEQQEAALNYINYVASQIAALTEIAAEYAIPSDEILSELEGTMVSSDTASTQLDTAIRSSQTKADFSYQLVQALNSYDGQGSLYDYLDNVLKESFWWSDYFKGEGGEFAKVLSLYNVDGVGFDYIVSKANQILYNTSSAYSDAETWLSYLSDGTFNGTITQDMLSTMQTRYDELVTLWNNPDAQEIASADIESVTGLSMGDLFAGKRLKSINTNLATKRIEENMEESSKAMETATQWTKELYSGQQLDVAREIITTYEQLDKYYAVAYQSSFKDIEDMKPEDLSFLASTSQYDVDYLKSNWDSIKGAILDDAKMQNEQLEEALLGVYEAFYGFGSEILPELMSELFGSPVGGLVALGSNNNGRFLNGLWDTKYAKQTFASLVLDNKIEQNGTMSTYDFTDKMSTLLTSFTGSTLEEFVSFADQLNLTQADALISFLKNNEDYFDMFKLLNLGFSKTDVANELDLKSSGRARTQTDNAVWKKYFMGDATKITTDIAQGFSNKYEDLVKVVDAGFIDPILSSLFTSEGFENLLNFSTFNQSEQPDIIKNLNQELSKQAARTGQFYNSIEGGYSGIDAYIESAYANDLLGTLSRNRKNFDDALYAYNNFEIANEAQRSALLSFAEDYPYLNAENWNDKKYKNQREAVKKQLDQAMQFEYVNIMGMMQGISGIDNIQDYAPEALADVFDILLGSENDVSTYLRTYSPYLRNANEMFAGLGTTNNAAISADLQFAANKKPTDSQLFNMLALNAETYGSLNISELEANENLWSSLLDKYKANIRFAQNTMNGDQQAKYFRALSLGNTSSYEDYTLPILNGLAAYTTTGKFTGFKDINVDRLKNSAWLADADLTPEEYEQFLNSSLNITDFDKWWNGDISGIQLDKSYAKQRAEERADIVAYGNETLQQGLTDFINAAYSDENETKLTAYADSIMNDIKELEKARDARETYLEGKPIGTEGMEALRSFYGTLGYSNLKDDEILERLKSFDADYAKRYATINAPVSKGIGIIAPEATGDNLVAQLQAAGLSQDQAEMLGKLMSYNVETGSYNVNPAEMKIPNFESLVAASQAVQDTTDQRNKAITTTLTGLLAFGSMSRWKDIAGAISTAGYSEEELKNWIAANPFAGRMLQSYGGKFGNLKKVGAKDVSSVLNGSTDQTQRYNYASPYLGMLLGSDQVSFDSVSQENMAQFIEQLRIDDLLDQTVAGLKEQGIDISGLVSWQQNRKTMTAATSTNEYASLIKEVSKQQDDLRYKYMFEPGSTAEKLFNEMRSAYEEGTNKIDLSEPVKNIMQARELVESEAMFNLRGDYDEQNNALGNIMQYMGYDNVFTYDEAKTAVEDYAAGYQLAAQTVNDRFKGQASPFNEQTNTLLQASGYDMKTLFDTSYGQYISTLTNEERDAFNNAMKSYRQSENKNELNKEFMEFFKTASPADAQELFDLGLAQYKSSSIKAGQYYGWMEENADKLGLIGQTHGFHTYTADEVYNQMQNEQAGITASADRARLLASIIRDENGNTLSLIDMLNLPEIQELFSTFGQEVVYGASLGNDEAIASIDKTVAKAEALERIQQKYIGNEDLQESLTQSINALYGSSKSANLELLTGWRTQSEQASRGRVAIRELLSGEQLGDSDIELLMNAAHYTDRNQFDKDARTEEGRKRIAAAASETFNNVSESIVEMLRLLTGNLDLKSTDSAGIEAAVETVKGLIGEDAANYILSLYKTNMFGQAESNNIGDAWLSSEQEYNNSQRQNAILAFVEEAIRTASPGEDGTLDVAGRMNEMNGPGLSDQEARAQVMDELKAGEEIWDEQNELFDIAAKRRAVLMSGTGKYFYTEDEIKSAIGANQSIITAGEVAGQPVGEHDWTREEANAMAQNVRLGYQDSVVDMAPFIQTFLGDNLGQWSMEDLQRGNELYQQAMSGDAVLNSIFGGIPSDFASELINVFEAIQEGGERAEEARKYINDLFNEQAISNTNKYKKNADAINSAYRSMKGTVTQANAQINKLYTSQQKAREDLYALEDYKTGSNEYSKQIASLIGMDETTVKNATGEMRDQIVRMSEGALAGAEDEVNSQIQGMFQYIKEGAAKYGIDINDYINFETGEIDASGIISAINSTGDSILAAAAATVFSMALKVFGNSLVWDFAKAGGSKPSGGGGGGGGGKSKSAAEKLIEKQKRLMDDLKHIFNMINYEISEYENAGELTNLNIMLGIQSEELEKEIEQIKQNISELVAQLEQTKLESDDWYALQDAIQEAEEAMKEASNTISENNRKIEENKKKILEQKITLEDYVDTEIRNRKQMQKDMLAGQIDLENEVLDVIKQRYQDEWDLMKENIEKQKEALEEEKELIDERLQARKDAEDEGEKYEKLHKLQAQLAIVSMDPTRTKDAAKLNDEIRKMNNEISWDLTEDDVDYQKSILDDTIESYDEYVSIGDEYLADLLEDNTNFAYEVNSVMKLSYDDFISWMKRNNENFAFSLQSVQTQMIDSWKETWYQMIGYTETYWDEVDQVLKSKESFLEFMKAGQDYINGSINQQVQLLQEWEETWDAVQKNLKDDAEFNHTDDYSNVGAASTSTERKFTGDKDIKSIFAGYTGKATDPDVLFNQFANWLKNTKGYGYTISNAQKNMLWPEVVKKANANAGKSGSAGSAGVGSKEPATISTGVPADVYLLEEMKQKKQTTGGFFQQLINGLFGTAKENGGLHGGLIHTTGLTWLDGTKSKPERILSAHQTELFDNMVGTLERISGTDGLENVLSSYILATVGMSQVKVPNSFMDIGGASYHAAGGMNIGSVNVVLNEAQFNTDDDYDEIARRVGDSFVKELSKQGMNVASYAI